MSLFLADESKTLAIATSWAPFLQPGLFTFRGEIGAGKTTFIRAMLQSVGIQAPIKSPTFSLLETYNCDKCPWQIHHLDLYRLQEEAELDYLGFRDLFTPQALICVEWPERAPQSLAQTDLDFTFTLQGSGRSLEIKALSQTGQMIFSLWERQQQ